MADESYPPDDQNPNDPTQGSHPKPWEKQPGDQPPQDSGTSADTSGGGMIETTGDAINAGGLIVEGAGVVADGAAAAVEGVGSILEGAGSCLEGCGSCSLAVLIGLFLTAQAAFAIFK